MQSCGRRWLALIGTVALTCVAFSASAGDLTNPGFEMTGGWGWTCGGAWGEGGSWRDGGSGDAHAGLNGATFDALSTLSADSYFVLHQELPAIAAQTWTVSAWMKTVNLDDGKSESWLEVQFWDATDTVLAQSQSAHVTGNQDWTQMTLSGLVAPPSTVKISVRGVVYTHAGGTLQTEFHLFDDFSATVDTN